MPYKEQVLFCELPELCKAHINIVSVKYVVACLDFTLTYRADRLYQGEFFPKNLNISEKYPGCIAKGFFIIRLAAITNRNFLTNRHPVEDLICMNID